MGKQMGKVRREGKFNPIFCAQWHLKSSGKLVIHAAVTDKNDMQKYLLKSQYTFNLQMKNQEVLTQQDIAQAIN